MPTSSLLFSVVCKVEFVPVSWKSNEGESRCYFAAVDCAPTPHHFLSTVSPKQDRCSVCMLPVLPSSVFLPGIPDYCSICLIALSECLLFVRSDVLEGSASIQNVPVWNNPQLLCEVLNPRKRSEDLQFLFIPWLVQSEIRGTLPFFSEVQSLTKTYCEINEYSSVLNPI